MFEQDRRLAERLVREMEADNIGNVLSLRIDAVQLHPYLTNLQISVLVHHTLGPLLKLLRSALTPPVPKVSYITRI